MQIKSPAAWAEHQATHWRSMPVLLRNIIAVAAIELALLGVLALYVGGWA